MSSKSQLIMPRSVRPKPALTGNSPVLIIAPQMLIRSVCRCFDASFAIMNYLSCCFKLFVAGNHLLKSRKYGFIAETGKLYLSVYGLDFQKALRTPTGAVPWPGKSESERS